MRERRATPVSRKREKMQKQQEGLGGSLTERGKRV
jgi:hypothetical protein